MRDAASIFAGLLSFVEQAKATRLARKTRGQPLEQLLEQRPWGLGFRARTFSRGRLSSSSTISAARGWRQTRKLLRPLPPPGLSLKSPTSASQLAWGNSAPLKSAAILHWAHRLFATRPRQHEHNRATLLGRRPPLRSRG